MLDPEGRAVARVALPDRLNVLEIGDDYVLGRATDDFDVEYVQLWSLHRDDGAALTPPQPATP